MRIIWDRARKQKKSKNIFRILRINNRNRNNKLIYNWTLMKKNKNNKNFIINNNNNKIILVIVIMIKIIIIIIIIRVRKPHKISGIWA